MRVDTLTPLPANSRIEITIPDDFIIDPLGIYSISSVDYLTSVISYDDVERKLTIDKFNSTPKILFDSIDITFGPVTNPDKT
jgi:hypothetical protein